MKKKVILIAIIGATVMGTVGCSKVETTGSHKEQEKQQQKISEESNRQAGMPNIKNFFEKKTAKTIWELRDNPDLTTYAYTQNMDGKFVYLGKCIGYGLPYTTQYTSPEKLQKGGGNSESGIWGGSIPQADPNGLYSSETTNATWLMLVNEETNETEIVYSEPEIIVSQTKLPKRLVAEWSLPAGY